MEVAAAAFILLLAATSAAFLFGAGAQGSPPSGSLPPLPQRAPQKQPECGEGSATECLVGGCPGTKECAGGFFSDCVRAKRVCVPNQTIGCSVDGCRFGYKKCNECGTGFGKCLPISGVLGCAGGNCS